MSGRRVEVAPEELTAVGAGDRRAFERLYAKTATLFLALASRQLGDTDVARDVVQQTFLSIWRRAATFDPARGHPMSWMLTILRNAGLDEQRRRARRPGTVDYDGLADWLEAEPPAPSRPLLHARVETALSALDPLTQRMIRDNLVEGYSSREIGRSLQTSANTVKSRIRRGVEQVRVSCLDDPERPPRGG